MCKEKIAVFDIDQTLIDTKWTQLHLEECKTYRAVYEKYANKDKPIKTTVMLIKQLKKSGVKIFFLTARDDMDRDLTRRQINKFCPFLKDNFVLKMVGSEFGIPERKEEYFKRILKDYDILFFMDDNVLNRMAIQVLGVTTLGVLE